MELRCIKKEKRLYKQRRRYFGELYLVLLVLPAVFLGEKVTMRGVVLIFIETFGLRQMEHAKIQNNVSSF